MAELPITHMTLYKHGVGFFERRMNLDGERVELSFRVEEMNDILKSLTVIDWGGGKVLGVDYATPQSRKERLQGCSIRLRDSASMRDLLSGLRGRRVSVVLSEGQEETQSQDETSEGVVAHSITGVMVGIDAPSEEQPMASSLVSLLLDETADEQAAQVEVVRLDQISAVEILDERGASDLRFFLETALSQEDYRKVTIRLSPGSHDLSVSYIAPAPTWRVSYRIVVESANNGHQPAALLLGWGIFDNRLEEDLKAISLSLVAGMPISFVYDLYTPFTPERPEVKEEARVAAAPVEFDGATPAALKSAPTLGAGATMAMAMRGERALAPAAPAPARRSAKIEDFAGAQTVETKGEAMGELFQYVIRTPVTVGRGQSAMVPVLSSRLDYRKDLLYNASKMPRHPVATLRLKNDTGLTMERGPVTVLEDGEYVGEAVLPFTAAGGELVIPYAVELGAKVTEDTRRRRETYRLRIKGVYLHIESWDIHEREYRITNTTADQLKVLIEHPREANYDLFDSPKPLEQTEHHLRFELAVPAHREAKLKVKSRRLVSHREELSKQSHRKLDQYLRQGLMDRRNHDRVVKLLTLYDTIADYEKQLKAVDRDRNKLYKSQEQIQGNMKALSDTGKEGALRARYVDRLGASEEELKALNRREADLRSSISQVEAEIKDRLKNIS